MELINPFNKQQIMIILQKLPGVDTCEIRKYAKFDSTAGTDNTFQLSMSDQNYCGARKGDIIDVTGTEFGGIIKKVEHKSGKVTLTGVTWRGLLNQHIIPPSIGTLSGDARSVLRTLLNEWLGSGGLIKAATGNSGFNISGFSKANKTILEGLNEAFSEAGLSLDIAYDGSNVILDAIPARDLSNDIELSQDYSAELYTSDSDLKFYNHCIAVGDGIRAEAWRLDNGTITTSSTNAPHGLYCIDIFIESEKEDDISKLREKAKEKLEGGKSELTMEMDISKKSELMLGDIVAAYDAVTGISGTATVSNINLIIEKGTISIDYEVNLKNESD